MGVQLVFGDAFATIELLSRIFRGCFPCFRGASDPVLLAFQGGAARLLPHSRSQWPEAVSGVSLPERHCGFQWSWLNPPESGLRFFCSDHARFFGHVKMAGGRVADHDLKVVQGIRFGKNGET